jgi:hypothetical protein
MIMICFPNGKLNRASYVLIKPMISHSVRFFVVCNLGAKLGNFLPVGKAICQ